MKKNSILFFYIIIFFGSFLPTQLFGVKLYDLVQERCIDQIKSFFEKQQRSNFTAIFNEQDENGKTALYHACKSGNLEIVKYLYYRGASLHDITEKNFLNTLHVACIFGHQDIILFLIRHGVNADQISNDKKRPYDVLCDINQISQEDKKEYAQVFDFAIAWNNNFKKNTALHLFLDLIDSYMCATRTTDTTIITDSLNLGFLIAYNQGMIKFFTDLYNELYNKDHNDYNSNQKQIEKQNTFEILFGASEKLYSKKAYQVFFIKKALREKNSEFCTAAINAHWEYCEKKIKKAVDNNFSSYQKDMITKVVLGKKISTFKTDINFYYA